MPAHVNIFDTAVIITKRDMCAILNLDGARPGLNFTTEEINKAYKGRALYFHPDKQSLSARPIPDGDCAVLMTEIKTAHTYLLEKKDNIRGGALPPENQIVLEFSKLFIAFTSLISFGTMIVALSSTFSNNQLKFRYLSELKLLIQLRPYLKNFVPGSAFLVDLKNSLAAGNEEDLTFLMRSIETDITDEAELAQFHELATAIQVSKVFLATQLTDDDAVDYLKSIYTCWLIDTPLPNPPSWNHILGVFFLSLSFSASNLPQFYNALVEILAAIWQHKGGNSFLFAIIPLILLSAVALSINLGLYLTFHLTGVALKAVKSILAACLNLIFSPLLLVLLPLTTSYTFAGLIFSFIESIVNLTLRLSINLILNVTDVGVFFLFGSHFFKSMQTRFDSVLDNLIKLQPLADTQPLSSDTRIVLHSCVVPEIDTSKKPMRESQESPAFRGGFFSPGLNKPDLWLEKTLYNIFKDNPCDRGAEHRLVVDGMDLRPNIT